MVFAILAATNAIFVWLFFPKTKGRTLEEVRLLLSPYSLPVNDTGLSTERELREGKSRHKGVTFSFPARWRWARLLLRRKAELTLLPSFLPLRTCSHRLTGLLDTFMSRERCPSIYNPPFFSMTPPFSPHPHPEKSPDTQEGEDVHTPSTSYPLARRTQTLPSKMKNCHECFLTVQSARLASHSAAVNLWTVGTTTEGLANVFCF
jgi:hypothetical protein